jgi:hypothetical protein
MTNTSCRRLDHEDLPQLKALWASHPSVVRVRSEELKSLSTKALDRNFNLNYYEYYGFFVDDILDCVISIKLWVGSPCFTLIAFKTQYGKQKIFRPLNNVLPLFDYVLEQCENRGIYTFYYCRPQDEIMPLRRKFRADFLDSSKLKDYLVVAEENIPANTKSQYATHRLVMGNRTYPIAMKVCKGVMNYEARSKFNLR